MANYSGRQPDNTSYIKTFVDNTQNNLWKVGSYTTTTGTQKSVLTPSSTKYNNLYIPGDIYCTSVVTTSDINLKQDVSLIPVDTTDKLMNLKPSSFSFKNDLSNNIHYGFIAQDLENDYPELVQNNPNKMYNNLKSINYLEIIPLLVHKIQLMQKEINELKEKVNLTD